MTEQRHKSFCRFCHAYCAIEVIVKDGKPVKIVGDTDDPVYGGYTCLKGRELATQYQSRERVRAPLKRSGKDFEPLALDTAMDEISTTIQKIAEQYGPRAIATYVGSGGYQNSAAIAVAKAWHKSIGSSSFYTSLTIDQTAKLVARSRFGNWGGGSHGFAGSDVCMILGNNTLVSHFSVPGGVPHGIIDGLEAVHIEKQQGNMAVTAQCRLQLLVEPGDDDRIDA